MLIDHFNLIAGIYDRFGRFSLNEPLRELLALSPNDLLLDAGGGTGRVANELRSLVKRILVLDVSIGMLRRAAGKGLTTIYAPAEMLPFPSGQIDRVILMDALHHVRDQRLVLDELKRVLAPGGRIVIEEPNIQKFWVKLIALGEKLLFMRSHFISAEEIFSLLSAPELKVSMIFDELSILLVAEKLL